MRPSDATVREAVERATGDRVESFTMRAHPIRGGLEASSIDRLSVSYTSANGRARMVRLVAKELEAGCGRERLVYETLVEGYASGFAPRLFATETSAEGKTLLLLEAIPRLSAWPWRAPRHAASVLERVARLHATTASAERVHARLSDWDYDAELERSALETVAAAEHARRHAELGFVDRALPSMRRIALGLDAVRRELLEAGPFPAAAIHGDLHPGNALLRGRSEGAPVLIDWGRSRKGSPLEDVSSWLHSLGSWEPEARRRHDTLLRAYLAARGERDRLGTEIREANWIAGATNAYAGALLYHLLVATSDAPSARRSAACAAAYDWCRIIRRADACLGSSRGARDRRIARPAPSSLSIAAP